VAVPFRVSLPRFAEVLRPGVSLSLFSVETCSECRLSGCKSLSTLTTEVSSGQWNLWESAFESLSSLCRGRSLITEAIVTHFGYRRRCTAQCSSVLSRFASQRRLRHCCASVSVAVQVFSTCHSNSVVSSSLGSCAGILVTLGDSRFIHSNDFPILFQELRESDELAHGLVLLLFCISTCPKYGHVVVRITKT
jgi:hypothetical protein